MRALTPLCELGVSGSGVGESGSVGRVSSRAGPRGRWGGCQKTLVGAQRIRYDLAFSTYERSIGKRASFALKFGFIAEKFAQA